MGLKDINLKPAYYSDEDYLLEEFYIPVLSKSVKYDRVAGYFSSNSLAIAAKGIAQFVNNGGKIRLIANIVMSIEDKKAIKQALEKKEEEVLAEIEALEDELKKNHIRMLGWMVKNNLIEIKIAVVNAGVEHQKIGILTDSDGNTIVFSGSDNETVQGWLYNDEQFHVFRSWINGDDKHLLPDISRFEGLWQDKGNRVKVYSVSTAFEQGLIRIAPANNQEFQRLSHRVTEKLLEEYEHHYATNREKNKIPLWNYQKEAVKKWIDNTFNGIFEMATGTGKTFTALGCVHEVFIRNSKTVVVITVPFNHLIDQWGKEIDKFGLNFDRRIIADGTNLAWRNELADGLRDITLGYFDRIIVLTTHLTFSSDDFSKIILANKDKFVVMLVADEVHGIGATKTKRGLSKCYDFNLGLSATPERWFDDTGTKAIYQHFRGVVFKFPLEDAITTINPNTNQTYLTPYYYQPTFVNLTEEELHKYIALTQSIINRVGSIDIDDAEGDEIKILLFKRADIIKNANAKIEALEKVIDELEEELKWTIIYCTPQQMNPVMMTLNSRHMRPHRFTMEEGTKSEEEYKGKSEREFILERFAEGDFPVLVAMKCLDEGVDIPPARKAMIMASSGNPREYVQRIGRIIRRFPGKEIAVVHDFVAIPSLDKVPSALRKFEMSIFQKEIRRYEQIAKIAANNTDALNTIYRIEDLLIRG